MRTPVRLLQLAVLWVLLPFSALAQPVGVALDYGPHAVGFRLVTELDYSRTVGPRMVFDGTTVPGELALPMEIGIWYPAERTSSSEPMTAETYKSLRSSAGRADLAADFARLIGFAGLQATSEEIIEALSRPTRAYRDARAAPGSFPLIIAGADYATAWISHEYLASHGYVVLAMPSSRRTATLQATRPDVALETQTRNLEYLAAFARRQALGDGTRLGVIGVNFDGMAALNYQMRNMTAGAVISVDGYEGKATGTATLQASPYFDTLRMRVPYLIFVQDEINPPPFLAHDRSIWNALKYSTRYWYVISGFNHARLISDVANVSTLTAVQRTGHAFVHQTMRSFLDAYVKGDLDARAKLEKSPASRLPDSLRKVAEVAVGLPAAPTAEEFERLITDGPIERAAEIYRAAARQNPGVAIFDERTINLYAFRRAQRKQLEEALAIRRIGTEAFPQSPAAAHQLGIAASDAGHPSEARSAFERALQLLEASTIPLDRKQSMAADIRTRLETLREK